MKQIFKKDTYKLSTIIYILWLIFFWLTPTTLYSFSYDNVPITPATWEVIGMTWPNIFNKSIPNSAKIIRPISYADKHDLRIGGIVHMPFSELGVKDTDITVTSVQKLTKKIVAKINFLPQGERPIVGIYRHQTDDVKTYHFRDEKGRIYIIHATPDHPFYVNNLHKYVYISNITDTMILSGRHDEIIHLICQNNKHKHCGLAYHSGKITTVYNVEVYQKHFYRVSDGLIKVHNAPCVAGHWYEAKPSSRNIIDDANNLRYNVRHNKIIEHPEDLEENTPYKFIITEHSKFKAIRSHAPRFRDYESHGYLSSYKKVKFAGELYYNQNTMFITNNAGHYTFPAATLDDISHLYSYIKPYLPIKYMVNLDSKGSGFNEVFTVLEDKASIMRFVSQTSIKGDCDLRGCWAF